MYTIPTAEYGIHVYYTNNRLFYTCTSTTTDYCTHTYTTPTTDYCTHTHCNTNRLLYTCTPYQQETNVTCTLYQQQTAVYMYTLRNCLKLLIYPKIVRKQFLHACNFYCFWQRIKSGFKFEIRRQTKSYYLMRSGAIWVFLIRINLIFDAGIWSSCHLSL